MAEAFVSLASDIALVIDDNGVIQSVAQSATTPISTNSSQWVGRPWADMVSGDTRRKVELMLTDLRTTGVARRREVNITGENDSDVPVAFSALRLGTLGPLLAVGRDLRAVSAIQQRFSMPSRNWSAATGARARPNRATGCCSRWPPTRC